MRAVSEKTQQIVPINIADVPQNTLTEINNGATEGVIQNTLVAINKLC